LIKHLKQLVLLNIKPILNLSIGVTFVDIPRFLQVAKAFVTCPVAEVMLECLTSKPK